jgi:hypothetical protein
MSKNIQIDSSKNIPYIENICDYSIEYIPLLTNTTKIETKNNETGITINCLPRLNSFSSPSARFKSRTTILRRNNNSAITVNLGSQRQDADVSKEEEKPNISYFEDKKEKDIIQNLSSNLEKTTTIENKTQNLLIDSSLKSSFLPFDENKNIPDVIKILNNELESIFLPENSIERQNYIYSLIYPRNYNNSLDLNEGRFLEPFSIINVIQFKEKQEKAFNKFHCDLNTSYNSRQENIYFSEKYNLNYKNESLQFFDNINNNTIFVKKSSAKVYISPFSHIVLSDYTKNRVNPFVDKNEEQRELDFFNQNYINDPDMFFYSCFKSTSFYQNFNRNNLTIKYEKDDKFNMCGFDYSYNDGIGKNSIAFKGIE